MMPIIDATPWLKNLYSEDSLHINEHKIPTFNRLMNHYPSWEKGKWLQLLLENGMPPPSSDGIKKWRKWAEKGMLEKEITQLFLELKESFSGPDLDIFLFPIDEDHHFLMEHMNKKNGLSFSTFILLFFHESLSREEVEALLIHEYHHAARLFHQKNNESKITLLESIVMEGLAEFEVARRLGSEYVSPWMLLYGEEELFEWWNRAVKNKRQLKDRKYHTPYIYGGKYGIPRWLGYAIGYRLVESFIKSKNNPPSATDLLKMSSEKIYQGSIFSD